MKIPRSLAPIIWDMNLHTIDPVAHRQFLIARIAEKGRWKDVLWLKKTYGTSAIKRFVGKSGNTSKKTKNFWQIM